MAQRVETKTLGSYSYLCKDMPYNQYTSFAEMSHTVTSLGLSSNCPIALGGPLMTSAAEVQWTIKYKKLNELKTLR